MHNNHKLLVKTVGIFLMGASLLACQSAPEKVVGASVINGQHLDKIAVDLKVLLEKQQQHDELLKEWQQLKPAISRLVVIEEELTLLLVQLDELSKDLTAKQAPAPAVEQVVTTVVPKKSVSQTTLAMKPASNAAAAFALQLTSVTEAARLPLLWRQLQQKHPGLFSNMPANYQQIQVKNTDYYRLKVGAFESQAQANQHCEQLKANGINCLVTSYTDATIAELEL